MNSIEIYERFCEFNEEHRLIEKGDTIIAGVSGGSDSMTMLLLLLRLQKDLDFYLHVLHVNHDLRQEAAEEEAFVALFCEGHGISCSCKKESVVQLSKSLGTGIEEAGRALRSRMFRAEEERLIREAGAKNIKIATAHHLEDRCETILWNMARGSALSGITALGPKEQNRIRPILFMEKAEILLYLEENGQTYCHDQSNDEDHYTRNRIRHHILPYLRDQINSQAWKHIASTADYLSEVEEYMNMQTEEAVGKYIRPFQNGHEMDLSAIRLHKVLLKNLIYTMLERTAGRKKDISAVHVEQIQKLFFMETGSRISLPYQLTAVRTYDSIRIIRAGHETKIVPQELVIPSEVIIGSGKVSCRIFDYSGQKIPENRYTKWFDYDTITTKLFARVRDREDYLVIRPDGTKKKLNRVMIDDKIPQTDRDSKLLIAMEHEILWIVGGRRSESYKISSKTKNVLEIKYQGGYTDERTY